MSRSQRTPPPVPRAPLLRLVGLGGALATGLAATVTADGATWFGVRGPTCPLGSCLGPLACPGCGLVRSTAAALHGDWAFAWQLHPAGPAITVLLVAGILLHLDILRHRCEGPVHQRARRTGHRILLAAVLLGWLLRLTLA